MARSKLPESAAFVGKTKRTVRPALNASLDLPGFLATAGGLTLPERRLLVEQAMLLIEQNYAHLPLKRAMHAVDPVQRLRLLRRRLDQQAPSTMDTEAEFHAEMLDIFTSVRDLHTNYLLPEPFASRIAFLPFRIEEFFEGKDRHYVVSHLVPGFVHPTLEVGVEVTDWNGVPIDRAVDVNGDRFPGSNPAARHSRGLEFLTLRPLLSSLPPDEHWVIVGYTDLAGNSQEHRQDWLVFDSGTASGAVDASKATEAAASLGLDIELDAAAQAKKMLFVPQVIAAEKKAKPRLTTKPANAGESVPSALPGVFKAESVETGHGTFGQVRIFTFSVDDPGGFVDEFVRLIGLLPQNGLIVDVRGNGGGHIFASEGLLQVLTPKEIMPEPTQFISTPLNLRIVKRHRRNPAGIDLGPWFESMDQAVETGSTYSTGHSITPTRFANSLGQQYLGPVVLITDARCYSATDIFAAGFQDHEIGTILGVDDNTGAGGANVWDHGLLQALLELPSPADEQTPYAGLPKGASMRVSMRRTLRVHGRVGMPLEDLGVVPDKRHRMTRRDVLEGNVDLMNEAGRLLSSMPSFTLDAVMGGVADGVRSIDVVTAGFGRLDVYTDGRPHESVNVTAGSRTIEVPEDTTRVTLQGFSGTELVASRTIP